MVCTAAPASGQAGEVRLGTCDRSSSVRPASVILTCADAGLTADDLTWDAWGTRRATALGTASVNNCDPDCANGTRDEYPIALTADRIETCRTGTRRYTRVRYDWPQESPFPPDAPGSVDPYVSFPCPLPKPRLTAMRLRTVGVGTAGSSYYVRVSVRLRVCAPRQNRLSADFHERKRIGSDTFAEHFRSFTFRHAGGCRFRSWKWKLRDEFFGVGSYSVVARLTDSQGQSTRRLIRRVFTAD